MSVKMFDNLRKVGMHYGLIRNNPKEMMRHAAEIARRVPHWDASSHRTAATEADFAVEWVRAGEIVYNLSHSLAALFALTSAPEIDWTHLPHAAFIIQVPRVYLPMVGTIEPESSYLYVDAATDPSTATALFVADYDTTATAVVAFKKSERNAGNYLERIGRQKFADSIQAVKINRERNIADTVAWLRNDPKLAQLPVSELEYVATRFVARAEADLVEAKVSAQTRVDDRFYGMTVLGVRFLANTLAYLTEPPPGTVTGASPDAQRRPRILNVLPPRDLVVQRAFRDAAKDAVAATVAGSVVGVRRVLKHHVRGHWRNQAVGPAHSQRRRTWIHPHERGSQDFGTVVRRVETLNIPVEPATN